MTFRRWYLLLYPTVLVATVLSVLVLVVYRVWALGIRQWTLDVVCGKRDRHTRIWGRPGAQCWGAPIVFYASTRHRDDPSLRVHERVHLIHALWCNAIAHAVLPCAGLWLGGVQGAGLGVLAAQAAFGVAYGGHFAWEWARQGFGPWQSAYMRIWSERIAYRIQDEFDAGQRPGAWGA